MPTLMPTYRERFLVCPTPERRQRAQHWLPWLLRDDGAALAKVGGLIRRTPANWLTVLAGMPSTRWIAILRPHATRGQHLRFGPTTAQVADLGRVICGVQDDDWLQHRYCGPLNYTGQERLESQSAAIQRLLSRIVSAHRDADLVFAVHVAGDPQWQRYRSPSWNEADAEQALRHVCQRFDIDPPTEICGDEFE